MKKDNTGFFHPRTPDSGLRAPDFPIIIALGCNLGNRRETLDRACILLEGSGIRILRRSRLYWTHPWGVVDQPIFLNAAVQVWTHLLPGNLLGRMHRIEAQLGRRRDLHWGPRRLDLDLILYGRVHCKTDKLDLPHPRLTQRDFVLAPLTDLKVPPPKDIAPEGWQALIRRIPAGERTLIQSAVWE